jgi:hypothetical protein
MNIQQTIYFQQSLIIEPHLECVLNVLCDVGAKQKWKLCYQGSEHGFSGRIFHAKCDNMRHTLTVVKSSNGNVFGGYTDAYWNHSNGYKEDANAFLFSLVNKDKKPCKMKIIREVKKYAIFCSSHNGPTFGTGHDICIADSCDKSTASFSYLGTTYEHPEYLNNSVQAKTFLAGSYYFKVAEIEVYQKVS